MVIETPSFNKIKHHITCHIVSEWMEDLEGGWQQESCLEGDIHPPPKLVHRHQLPCLLGGPV